MTIVLPDEERLTYSIIGAFYEVYNTIGFGLLEHLYVMALELELRDLDPQSRARVTAELNDGRFTIATDEPHASNRFTSLSVSVRSTDLPGSIFSGFFPEKT